MRYTQYPYYSIRQYRRRSQSVHHGSASFHRASAPAIHAPTRRNPRPLSRPAIPDALPHAQKLPASPILPRCRRFLDARDAFHQRPARVFGSPAPRRTRPLAPAPVAVRLLAAAPAARTRVGPPRWRGRGLGRGLATTTGMYSVYDTTRTFP